MSWLIRSKVPGAVSFSTPFVRSLTAARLAKIAWRLASVRAVTEPGNQPRLSLPNRFERPWLRSHRMVPRQIVGPLDRFLRTEVGSGFLLLGAAFIALVWSNVAETSYETFWTTSVSVEIGSLSLSEDLRHVINDLLMAVFFYVVALEVKREFLFGGLQDRRTAAVPVAAALGTMVGAAVVYVAVNLDGGALSGWAIPIATDIAFALAVLGVAGRRAPPELRAFMLTLAVVDDLGTIGVIALFFGDAISLAWLGGALLAVILVLVLQRLHVRTLVPYLLLAGALWVAVFESGIHATIAGVVLGFLTPAWPFYPREETGGIIASHLESIKANPDVEFDAATMDEASRLAREAVSPLARMESALHPWSAFVVLPLFALANAGVPVSLEELGDALTSQIGLGILLGLVVGAPIAGIGLAYASVRFSGARLPPGLDWPAIAGVAPLKGIGFTVAIFIATLAFDDPERIDEAKLAILIASALAAIIGLTALAFQARRRSAR
jgi:Na+:H+ antiporter, NhaA family